MNSQSRPQKCNECHSNDFVPIIEGHPEGRLGILELQGKISLAGCFEISTGSPIWACLDCGERVSDAAFRFSSSNHAQQQEYNASIERVFHEYEPVGAAGKRRLRGLRLLRILSQRYLDVEASFQIVKSQGSFEIKLACDVVTNSLFSNDRFSLISECLEGEELFLPIRCRKEEISVIATQLTPKRILVKKK